MPAKENLGTVAAGALAATLAATSAPSVAAPLKDFPGARVVSTAHTA